MTFIDINKRSKTIENPNALWPQIKKNCERQLENDSH